MLYLNHFYQMNMEEEYIKHFQVVLKEHYGLVKTHKVYHDIIKYQFLVLI